MKNFTEINCSYINISNVTDCKYYFKISWFFYRRKYVGDPNVGLMLLKTLYAQISNKSLLTKFKCVNRGKPCRKIFTKLVHNELIPNKIVFHHWGKRSQHQRMRTPKWGVKTHKFSIFLAISYNHFSRRSYSTWQIFEIFHRTQRRNGGVLIRVTQI